MHGIIVPDKVTRSRNGQDMTLGWIKLRIPLFLQLLKDIQIALKPLRVIGPCTVK